MQNRDLNANNASFGPKDVPLLRLPVNSPNAGFGNAYAGPMAGYQHQQPPPYFVASSAATHHPMHYPHPNHVQYQTSPNPPSSDAMRMSSWVSSDSSRLSSYSPHASPRGSSRSVTDPREVDEHNTDGQEDEMSPRSLPPSSYPNTQNFSPQSTSSPILEEIPAFRLGVSSAPSSLRIPSNSSSHRRQSISSPNSARALFQDSNNQPVVSAPEISSLHVLWVNNLPLHWTEAEIGTELQALLDLHIKRDRIVIANVRKEHDASTESLHRGMAIIGLSSRDECETAMQILRHCKVQGKSLYISFRQPLVSTESEDANGSANTLFVANVHPGVSEDQIKLLFMQFGDVLSVTVVRNRHSNVSRGFVFIQFAEHASCELALRHMQNEYFCGQQLKLKLAKPPPAAAATPSMVP